MNDLRSLPAVDRLLQTQAAAQLISQYGRQLTLNAVRAVLTDLRHLIQQGEPVPEINSILDLVEQKIEQWLKPTLVPVINASGVILHTNLGRAPLCKSAIQAIQANALGYCTLEYELEAGKRGSRSVHAENLLTRLTGAEAAFVVNNNAAAVLLTLSALAKRRRVIISRTQLVEIGGGFRIPDVLKQSGAALVEIGTTNRVHLTDYETELAEQPAGLVLRAHSSNYRIIGFTSEPTLEELVNCAHNHQTPVVDDLGSGALLDTANYGLAHEPTVQESLAAGVDIVCFSGDKLLGGPQAGIILGKSDLIAKIKKHPLARAVRADKLCLAALSATLLHYIKDEAVQEIPIWQMISLTPEAIRTRAKHWARYIGQGEIIPGLSTVGGGSLPEETLPTYVLALKVAQPNRFLTKLRKMNPPIIGRVENELVVLDPRTVLPEQEGAVLVGLKNALGGKI